MDHLAYLAERYSNDELRITYQQNVVLPHVARGDLIRLYDSLRTAGLAAPNEDRIIDIIACPGLDFCNLANARSIPIALANSDRFRDASHVEHIGPLRLNISGCINACGHHHAGHIGILGVDKKGTEQYQIMLGGSGTDDASIGKIIGPSFAAADVPDAIESIVETYLAHRNEDETFLSTYRRIGSSPFKETLYGTI